MNDAAKGQFSSVPPIDIYKRLTVHIAMDDIGPKRLALCSGWLHNQRQVYDITNAENKAGGPGQ